MEFNNSNIYISKSAQLGQNVKIGNNTIIHDNVIIDDNTIIGPNCIIGEPLSSFYSDPQYQNPVLNIGKDSIIRANTIIYAGSQIGEHFQTAHFSCIRECCEMGDHCVIGMYNNILPECKFGNYVHIHSYCSIGERTQLDNFVFLYPGVIITTDPTPPSNVVKPVKIEEFSQITAGVLLLPGTEIGKHCFIGAQSKVAGIFEDYSFIMGSPAKRCFDTRKVLLLNEETKRRQYPWPYNFDRNMPWKGIGYDVWKKSNEK